MRVEETTMAGAPNRQTTEEHGASREAQLHEHLQAICASTVFASSATLKNLLSYLFNNRNEQINEYKIAVEALSRKADFDPQIDATVRVQISRLRRRLKDFYLSEGHSSAIRFSIPLGTHQLALDRIPDVASHGEATALLPFPKHDLELHTREAEERQPRPWRLTLVLGVLVVALSILCGWQYWQLKAHTAPASTQLQPVWAEFSANGKPIQIVIPNPVFFSWQREIDSVLMARDTKVNNFMQIDDSPELTRLRDRLGPPELSQYYTVSSDVLASLKLMHYLDANNVKIDIAISSDASAELFEGENVILVGTPGTLTPFKNQLDRLYFEFNPQGGLLTNRQPLGSEKREYRQIAETQSRSIFPGLLAVLPGANNSELMILAGQRTAALVSFLTSSAGSQQLQAARQRAGGAHYFEAVVLSEAEGNTILNNNLVALRPYAPKPGQN